MWDVRTIEVTGDEPVTLAEAKFQCRISTSDEDGFLTRIISAAREKVENITGLLLRAQTVEITFTDGFPSRLPRAPLTEITSLTYADAAESTAEFDGFDLYTSFDVPMLRPAIASPSWPSLYPGGLVTVTASGGYAQASDVPQQLRHAILLLISHWYDFRGADADVPDAVYHLCNDFRLNRL